MLPGETKTPFEYAQEVHAAAKAYGIDELGDVRRHRRGAAIQHGYSFLDFRDDGVHGREEGHGEVWERPLYLPYDHHNLIGRCLEVLSTGRTVECGKGVGLRAITEGYVHFQSVGYPLQHLAGIVEGSGDLAWNVNPDYQRGHVWTDRQRVLFMGHLLENGRMPLIFLQDWGFGVDKPYEVIDGKQRLTTCLMFVKGEIPARLSDGRDLWYPNFNEVDRRVCPSIKCGLVRLPDRAAVLRFYIKLNRGGTIHSDDEIRRVRQLLREEETSKAAV